jgi:hypothetical protein
VFETYSPPGRFVVLRGHSLESFPEFISAKHPPSLVAARSGDVLFRDLLSLALSTRTIAGMSRMIRPATRIHPTIHILASSFFAGMLQSRFRFRPMDPS